MNAYQQLEAIFGRLSSLQNASSMLQWDNATMMPSGSGAVRAEQLTVLAELAHDMLTQPAMGELLAKAEAQAASLTDWQQANLREMKRTWQHASALPGDLVAAITKSCLESELFWRTARKENNFKGFIPYQKKVLGLVRESAAIKANVLGLTPYDALLDQYDPGTRAAQIDVVFDDLAQFLPGFIQEVTEFQQTQKPPLDIKQTIPAAQQKALGEAFMRMLGFDFTKGRLDESAHPFCGGVPGDVRLTARYNEHEFLSGFFAVMHETGHALYEMHLPETWRFQPVGQARGMAFHESQSLFTEMQLCIRREFLAFAAPHMRSTFKVDGKEWSADNIYHLMTRVKPSLIRVDADEVTYPAHIILRYRIERQLIDGSLAVEDLPAAWNEQMRLLLGITPPTDADGCMQDIHWPDGSFGYFPTYTLGAMIAAQLFHAIEKAIPDIHTLIACGEFKPIYAWLATNVHALASRYSSPELLKHATGETLNSQYYKQHLKARYLSR